MKILTVQEQKSLEQFFQLNQTTLLKAMVQYLKKHYEKVIASEKYVIAVGDIPVGLVAHLDTVFHSTPEDIYYDRMKNVMWSPDGLGADDRAGVYAIAQIVKGGLKPTVILTTDEEIGGIGASALVKAYPNCPVDLKYIIELDRRGSLDCVFYDCGNSKFEDYIESFGFVTNWGTFSDISIICPKWKIAGVNLSIGYYDEHSTSEILRIGQMFNTIKLVQKMLLDAETADHFEYIKAKYLSFSNEYYEWDPTYGVSREDWDRWFNPSYSLDVECDKCKTADNQYNLVPVLFPDKSTKYYCVDCLAKSSHIRWCSKCGEPYFDKRELKEEICYSCREVVND